MEKHLSLYTEANPNPNSLKFVVNYMLLPEGASYDFPDEQQAKKSPLAFELFQFDYVERVFMMSNFITITKKSEINWEDIKEELKKHISGYLQSGQPIILADIVEEKSDKTENEAGSVDQKIKDILNEYIRPAVEQDGGAIQFHSYEDGIVKVLLQGACSGCPSSTITLKAGIENLLKRMIPEIKSVEAEGV